MKSCSASCVILLWLCCGGCRSSPLFYNVSMEGSGDEAEPELIFPASFSTKAPAHVTVATEPPGFTTTITNTITTTMIRLKDFVLTRVVDFLQENLLIIIVVTSLLIVLVFIICCASAMSHKRKLEAYKPLPNPPRKYKGSKNAAGRSSSCEPQDRPYAVDHVKRVHTQISPSPKHLRTPSKALVGEKGRDVRSSPRQEVRKVREAEEVEKRREEPKVKEQVKQKEEVQQSAGPSASSGPPVCTCHLRRAHH